MYVCKLNHIYTDILNESWVACGACPRIYMCVCVFVSSKKVGWCKALALVFVCSAFRFLCLMTERLYEFIQSHLEQPSVSCKLAAFVAVSNPKTCLSILQFRVLYGRRQYIRSLTRYIILRASCSKESFKAQRGRDRERERETHTHTRTHSSPCKSSVCSPPYAANKTKGNT